MPPRYSAVQQLFNAVEGHFIFNTCLYQRLAYGVKSVPAKTKEQTYFKTFTTQKVYTVQ
jgi:hypothetical protein